MNLKKILPIGITSIFLLLASCSQTTTTNQSPTDQTQISNDNNATTNKELTDISVCYSGTSGTQIVTWYAFEKGLFSKHGLDANLVAVKGGSTAVAAMISGEMNFCQIAGPAVVNAVVAEQDLVMIAGLFNTYVTSFITNSELQTPEDLKGKSFAISKPGGASDSELRAVFKELNIKPDEEVAILAIGKQGARLAAMETGEIGGTILSPPTSIIAQQKGYREFVKLSSLNLPYQHTGLVSTKQYLEENPEIAENFMKAIVEAISMMKNDESGTVEVMSKYMLLDKVENEDILKESYQILVQDTVPDVPYPTLDGIQALLTRLGEENPQAQNFQPTDVVDTTILKKLEQDGFVK